MPMYIVVGIVPLKYQPSRLLQLRSSFWSNSGPRLTVSPDVLLRRNSDGPTPPLLLSSPRTTYITLLPAELLRFCQVGMLTQSYQSAQSLALVTRTPVVL